VLVEVDYWCSERLGVGAFVALLADVEAGAFAVEHPTSVDLRRIRQLVDRYADSDIGYVDAAVIALAERLGEPKVATLDRRHFSLVRAAHVDALELLPDV
jgi:predicted nucleic acid-binding protein